VESGTSQALRFTLDASKNSTLPLLPINNSFPLHSILYQAQDLAPGPHQLNVTYLDASSSVYLDYWVYTASVGEVTDSQQPNVDHSPDKGSSNKRRLGAIIGGLVGGIVFLLLLIALLFFLIYRRRRRRRDQIQPTAVVAEPYTDPSPASLPSASPTVSKGKGKAAFAQPSSPSRIPSTSAASSAVTPTQDGSTMLLQTGQQSSLISNDPPVDGSSPTPDIPLIRITTSRTGSVGLGLVTLPDSDSSGIEARFASQSNKPARSKEQTGADYFSLETRRARPSGDSTSLGPPTTLGPPPTFGPPTSPPPAYHDSHTGGGG
jgi:hypothetical protein